MNLIEWIKQPWPWYVAGPLIGLTVPTLLIIGNKSFGISSSLRHVCAACVPAKIPFFQYDWKKESWNLFFVAGILLGGIISAQWIDNPNAIIVDPSLKQELASYGINNLSGLVPSEIFNWPALLTLKGFIMMVVGGFMVGFGTRYAGGCTSGPAISGICNLQFPSLLAVIGFFAGGLAMTHLLFPLIF
jgi:uncharacterized membrane protein YedE/YeeE